MFRINKIPIHTHTTTYTLYITYTYESFCMKEQRTKIKYATNRHENKNLYTNTLINKCTPVLFTTPGALPLHTLTKKKHTNTTINGRKCGLQCFCFVLFVQKAIFLYSSCLHFILDIILQVCIQKTFVNGCTLYTQ